LKIMKRRSKYRYIYLGIPIILNLILYARGLTGDFVWDDRSLILQNPLVQNHENMLKIFKYSLTIFGEDYGYYRPLSIISFAFDYLLWQKDAFGFHLTNLLLHIFVIICLFYFCHKIFGFVQGIFVSLLFTTFAVHIENIVFISGRMDILATLFMLLSMIIYFSEKGIPLILRLLLCYVLSLLALLSKEVAFIFGLIFILIVVFKIPHKQWRTHFLRVTLFIGGSIISYIVMRAIFLEKPIPESPIATLPLLTRIINIPRLIIIYSQLILFPFNLNARHYEFVKNDGQFLSLSISVVFLVIIIYIILRRIRAWQIKFGGFWFLIGLIPVMNIFPLSGIPVAERYLYFPSIGMAICLAGAISPGMINIRKMDIKDFLKGVIILLIFTFNIIFTFLRIPVWRNEEIFFKTMATQNQNSPLAHHNLGHYYYRQEDWQHAEKEFKKAIALNPYFPAPHASLGDIYTRTGRYQEAINEYNIYLRLLPSALNRAATISRIKELQDLLDHAPPKY
ncbi:MAG: tetratricopeptide repeat protein, partial [bacterium]